MTRAHNAQLHVAVCCWYTAGCSYHRSCHSSRISFQKRRRNGQNRHECCLSFHLGSGPVYRGCRGYGSRGKVCGVTSKGETTKCKKFFCDPSYLSSKLYDGDMNNVLGCYALLAVMHI